MKLSLNLLKKFTPLDKSSESEGKSAKEIADRITLSLTEVESIEKKGDDTILEIENKALTHRPDCFSHLGIAREIAAYFNVKCDDPLPELTKKQLRITNDELRKPLDVKVEEKDLCPRYCAVVLTNIKVDPSPKWLAETLQNIGIRPINNVVDITNYVMVELGQPLHAFDYDKVEGHEIQVRTAKKGEKIITLDGKERELTEEMLVIADAKKPIGIAGVMGGVNTEVTNETKTIVLEAAAFESKNNRKTSKALNLRTDAATRFEKNLDPNLPYPAFVRAVELLQEHAQTQVGSEVIDINVVPLSKRREIKISPQWINQFLGTTISIDDMKSILKRLSIESKGIGSELIVTIPTWRPDLTMEADIAEEVARIYGYDNIPVTLPSQTDFTPKKNKDLQVKKELQILLQGMGFTETLNSPFVGMDLIKKAHLDKHEHLQLQNPLSVEQEYMRRSLLPQLLETVKKNMPYKDKVRLYEINKLFVPQKDKQPLEPVYLTAVTLGDNYRTVKGFVEELFERLHIENSRFEQFPNKDCDFLDELVHPNKTAQVYVGTKPMGLVGFVHPKVLTAFNLPENIISFDLHIGTLVENAADVKAYKPIPQYPPVIEDITIDTRSRQLGSLIEKIKETSNLITKVELVDSFQNKHTLRLTFQDPERNLTEKEVGKIKEKIIANIA